MSTPCRPLGSFCRILRYVTVLSTAHLLLPMQCYCSVPVFSSNVALSSVRNALLALGNFLPTKAYSDCLRFLVVCLDPYLLSLLVIRSSRAFLCFITILKSAYVSQDAFTLRTKLFYLIVGRLNTLIANC